MSEIVKTEALVLRKIDFGDSSRIAHFYTKEYGRISAIIKGAKSPKSKLGNIIDTLNHLQIVIYNKENRSIQLISDADIINHFHLIKDDYESMKYAIAIIELLNNLTVEHDPNKKLFDGSVKILGLIEKKTELPGVLFLRYFLFFLKELGYELHLEKCSYCERKILISEEASYIFDAGVVCKDCRTDHLTSIDFSQELFEKVLCLSTKQKINSVSQKEIHVITSFLERFLMNSLSEFKGLKSLKIV